MKDDTKTAGVTQESSPNSIIAIASSDFTQRQMDAQVRTVHDAMLKSRVRALWFDFVNEDCRFKWTEDDVNYVYDQIHHLIPSLTDIYCINDTLAPDKRTL